MLCFTLYLGAIFQVQAPGGLIFGGAIITEGLLRYWIGGFIFGGAYFRNFTVHYFQHFIFRYQILKKVFLTKFLGPLIFSTCAEIKCGNEVCKFKFQVLYSCYLLLFHCTYIYISVGYIKALEQQINYSSFGVSCFHLFLGKFRIQRDV